MAKSKTKKALLKLLKSTFSDLVQCEEVDVKEAYRLPDKKVRVKIKEYPFQLNLFPDGKAIHIYPEMRLNASGKADPTQRYILFDPETYYSDISGFFRLDDDDRVTLSGKDSEQLKFLNISPKMPGRKLSIINDEGSLIFKSHVIEPRSCISPLFKDKKIHKITDWRLEKLQRIRRIFGGPIEMLPEPEALTLIREVNDIMSDEAWRPKDDSNRPGGVISLPDDAQVFIVGDLHTRSDNLLTILSQNGFLEALEQERAYLIILGDAVHPEGDCALDEMDSSMLIMDLIFKLKVRFPRQLFYLRGNHDSYSEEIAKGGIPQGMLWGQTLVKKRSTAYKKEMDRFYEQIPYLAYSKNFVACHAAAPTSSPSYQDLINIRQRPQLIKQLISNRLKSPNRPSGYGKGDVKRLRKCLGVAAETPLVVGHTPLALDETLWENVGEIDNHYIAYAADLGWVGVMTQIGDKLYPLRYPVEPISAIIDQLTD